MIAVKQIMIRAAGGMCFVFRIALGALLIASCMPKLRQTYDFLSSIYRLELFSPGLGLLFAVVFPILLLVVGGCLIIGVAVRGALLWVSTLSAAYIMLVISVMRRELHVRFDWFSVNYYSQLDYNAFVKSGGIFVVSILLFLWFSTKAKRKSPEETICRTSDA